MPNRISLIRNPMSGRLIKENGPVAQKLKEEGVILPKAERSRKSRKSPKSTGIKKIIIYQEQKECQNHIKIIKRVQKVGEKTNRKKGVKERV